MKQNEMFTGAQMFVYCTLFVRDSMFMRLDEKSSIQNGILYQTPNTFSQHWIEIQQRNFPFSNEYTF